MLKVPAFSALVVVLLSISMPEAWVERSSYLMGTELDIAVPGPRGPALSATDGAFEAVRHLESVLSDWQSQSELSLLNRSSPAEPATMSEELASLLGTALEWTSRTDGAFDPGIGSLNDAWDLRGAGRIPSDSALASSLSRSGLRRFHIDMTARALQRPDRGSWIDAGGFGKGAGLSAAARALKAKGVRAGILNFGGQVLVFGDTSLRVDIARPDARSQSSQSIHIRNMSVSTSGQSERYIEVRGVRYGHILDPRTGRPVPAWGSVTVVHPDPMTADILSTALFVMGPEQGMLWLRGRNTAALFQVMRDGTVESIMTPEFRQYTDGPITIPGE